MCCLWTFASLWQPVLYLDVSVLHSTVACAAPTSVCSTAACAALERISSTAGCAVLGRVCVSVTALSILEVSGLQLLVLQLNIFVQQQPALCQEMYGLQSLSLCCTWTCLSTSAFVLHLACLSTRVLNWTCLPERALCCTMTCLSTKACAAPVRVCLQESITSCS
jgi:hypothetical protein